MKHILITIAAVFLLGCAPTLIHAKSRKYEVLVYGATPAGVCASVAAAREGASVALSSIRVEPTWMMLGHSAGVAAAMASKTKVDVQQLPYNQLKKRLKKQNQLIEFPTDYVINEELKAAAK